MRSPIHRVSDDPITTSDNIPTVDGFSSPSVVLITDSPTRPISVNTAAGVDAGRDDARTRSASPS